MKILITEEALQSGKGHWPSYIGGVATGLRSHTDKVDVLIHKKATRLAIESVAGTPYFSRNCWVDPESQRALGGIRHNLSFLKELKQWLNRDEEYDWILALTMRLQHLLAFALLSRSRLKATRNTRFLLLFVQGFGVYRGANKPTDFPASPSNMLARLCFLIMGKAVRSGRVILAAETKGMQEELERFTGLSVSLFPHPIAPPVDLPTVVIEKRSTITITCPGFARHEKGNDLLQEAIKILLDTDDNLRFIMQWPDEFDMPDGTTLGPDPLLSEDDRVEYINEGLDELAYQALLKRSDLIILPYRKSSYHHRVSRVAIEVAAMGIPIIYTQGTWSEEVAEIVGAGVVIEGETVQSIISSIQFAVANLPELLTSAQKGANNIRAYHSVENLRNQLLQQ